MTDDPSAGLVLIGGGEHACVVADAVRAAGRLRILGYADLVRRAPLEARFGIRFIGDDAEAIARHATASFVLALGAIDTSTRAIERYESAMVRFATVVHPGAHVSASATLAAGAVVLAGAIVNTGAIVEAHVIINSGAVVEHDVHVGRLSHIAPGAVIGGGARVGAGAFVGLGSRVRDHVIIGAGAVIGMGAAVVGDVPERVTAVGVPARAR